MADQPRVNIGGMREQVARIHLALLPAAPNAVLSRQADVERDGLGAPETHTPDLTWQVPVYEYRKTERRGRWSEAGVDGRAVQRFLIGRSDPDDPEFEPAFGDTLTILGRNYKVTDVKAQAVAGQLAFWNIEGERV